MENKCVHASMKSHSQQTMVFKGLYLQESAGTLVQYSYAYTLHKQDTKYV